MLQFSTIFSLLAIAIYVMFTSAPEGRVDSRLLKRSVKVGSNTYSYQVYVPPVRSITEKLPVIVFLHGIGQRGEGGFVPTEGSAGALARSYLERVVLRQSLVRRALTSMPEQSDHQPRC